MHNQRIVASPNRLLTSFSWFRQGVPPVWEDPSHKNGGSLQIHWKINSSNPSMVNQAYTALLFSLVGNEWKVARCTLQGLRVVDKASPTSKCSPYIRFELWFTNSKDTDWIFIKRTMAQICQAPKLHIELKYHRNHEPPVEVPKIYNRSRRSSRRKF